jgi:hypothetical protein
MDQEKCSRRLAGGGLPWSTRVGIDTETAMQYNSFRNPNLALAAKQKEIAVTYEHDRSKESD